MRIVHHECASFLKDVAVEGLQETTNEATKQVSKEEFKKLFLETVGSYMANKAADLGLDAESKKNVDPRILDDRFEVLWSRMVDHEMKREKRRESNIEKQKRKLHDAEAAAINAQPEALFKKIIDMKIDSRLQDLQLVAADEDARMDAAGGDHGHPEPKFADAVRAAVPARTMPKNGNSPGGTLGGKAGKGKNKGKDKGESKGKDKGKTGKGKDKSQGGGKDNGRGKGKGKKSSWEPYRQHKGQGKRKGKGKTSSWDPYQQPGKGKRGKRGEW